MTFSKIPNRYGKFSNKKNYTLDEFDIALDVTYVFIFPEKDGGHPMNYLEMQQAAGVVARNVWIHGMFRFSQKHGKE